MELFMSKFYLMSFLLATLSMNAYAGLGGINLICTPTALDTSDPYYPFGVALTDKKAGFFSDRYIARYYQLHPYYGVIERETEYGIEESSIYVAKEHVHIDRYTLQTIWGDSYQCEKIELEKDIKKILGIPDKNSRKI